MNVLIGYIQKNFCPFSVACGCKTADPEWKIKKIIFIFFTVTCAHHWCHAAFFSFWGDNDALLDKIRSETFTENLSEASRDISRMEYLRNDYYRREYENAAALDVKGTAEGYLEQFGFMVKQSSVELTENYEVRKIILTVAEKEPGTQKESLWNREKRRAARLCLTN